MANVYRTSFFLALAALGTVLASPRLAPASDVNGRYAVLGQGTYVCSDLDRHSDKFGTTLAWAAGYLTAMNYHQEGLYDLTGEGSWTDWLIDYCRANPADSVHRAVKTLVHTFWPQRQTMAPATVIPPAPQPRTRTVPAGRPARSPQY